MRETDRDLAWLQGILDRSIDAAGPFLRESLEMPEKSLSAEELAAKLDGVVEVALATVTSRGEPRVAPIGAVFLRGRFAVPTVAAAARVRQLRANPAVSLTLYEGTSLAVIVHGRAELAGDGDPRYTEAEELYRSLTGVSIAGWGADPVFVMVEPDRVFTFDRSKPTDPDVA